MNGLPHDTAVLLRSGNKAQPGLFERVMAMACQELWWFTVEWIRPDPELGREGTFLRDVELSRRCDLMLAFFATDEITGGTGHCVEKAMDLGRPVYAWGLRDGAFVRIGEHDPGNAWGNSVPKP